LSSLLAASGFGTAATGPGLRVTLGAAEEDAAAAAGSGALAAFATCSRGATPLPLPVFLYFENIAYPFALAPATMAL
jgi:hypothetical protein